MTNSPKSRAEEPAGEVRAGDAGVCVSCGATLQGEFCHVCGEKALAPEDLRVGTFVRRAAGAAFDADSRLWRTLRLLVTQPGMLTAEFMRGRREPYVHPLQVFLLANLVSFLALAWWGGFDTFTTRLEWHVSQPLYGELAQELVNAKAAPGSDAAADYIRRFDEATPNYANSLVILMVPLIAAGLALLYVRRRIPFVQHLVFALHFMAFELLLSTVLPFLLLLLVLVAPPVRAAITDGPISLSLLVIFALYLALGLRTAYDDGRVASAVRGAATAVLLFPALVLYRAILFFAVYYTLK